jgi:hypothetical protein
MEFFSKQDGNGGMFYNDTMNYNCRIKYYLHYYDNDKFFTPEEKKILKNIFDLDIDQILVNIKDVDLNILSESKYNDKKFTTEFKKKKANRIKYFKNPLVKILYLILNYTFLKLMNDRTNTITGNNVSIYYKVSCFFIYKFIKFIVNQGRDIVTTLEHLKFYFLNRTGQIDSYNVNQTDNNKKFTYSTKNEALTGSKFYTNKFTINNIDFEEKVDIGGMQTFQLISILQNLSNNTGEFDISNIDFNDKNYLAIPGSDDINAIFVMLSNIKLYDSNDLDLKYEETTKKLCSAEFDTLEFTQGISSTTIGQKDGYQSGGYYIHINNSKHKKHFKMKDIIKEKNKIKYRKMKQRHSLKYIKNKQNKNHKRKTKINN